MDKEIRMKDLLLNLISIWCFRFFLPEIAEMITITRNLTVDNKIIKI